MTAADGARDEAQEGEAWNAYLFWVGIGGKRDFDEGMRRAGNSEAFIAGYNAALEAAAGSEGRHE